MEQDDHKLKHMANISIAHATNPFEELRARMLSRGAASFKTFQRRFRIMDDDRSYKLSYEEFKTGMRDIGLIMEEAKMKELFMVFDKDCSGTIDMTEFITTLRPEMNAARTKLVKVCFAMMDKTGDRSITIEDLVGAYSVKSHPKWLSGEWTERKVYEAFLKTFQAEEHADGKVTEEEFITYYACLSASIDNDAYFRLMMRNSWKHLDKDGNVF